MHYILAFLFVFNLVGSVFAQGSIQRIDSILNDLATEETFSGTVLVAEKGKTIYTKSFGYANAEKKIALEPNTIFLIGSVAKTMTATAILKLKEKGKLSLDDPITKYFPELSYESVTLRHMLSHTSGILEYQSPEIIREMKAGSNNAHLIGIFARLAPKLVFEPGTKWEYSNTNYILLASVVEKVSGKTFPQFVNESVFIPSGMTHSFIGINNVPELLRKQIASGYRYVSPLATIPVNVETLEGGRRAYAIKQNLFGAGNTYTTTGDLLKFHQALQNKKILGKRTLLEMYSPVKLTSGKDYRSFERTNYPSMDGLGWFIADDPGGRIVYHPGGDIGFVSYFIRNTTQNQVVIVLSNIELLRHSTPTALMRILNHQSYKLDLKSLSSKMGREYNQNGSSAMLSVFNSLKDRNEYAHSEDDMNELGYRLLYDKKDIGAATEIFKINAEQFPRSYNVWDSLGEVYFRAGNNSEAIKNYERSLQINPKNEGGLRMLEEIRKQKP